MLTDIKVVAFDLLLRILDGAGHQAVLDRLAFFHAEPAHDALDTVGAKNAHQIVFNER